MSLKKMQKLSNNKKPYTTPEITKVKMQPEQAVLSCCTNVIPGTAKTQTTAGMGSWNQCVVGATCTMPDCSDQHTSTASISMNSATS